MTTSELIGAAAKVLLLYYKGLAICWGWSPPDRQQLIASNRSFAELFKDSLVNAQRYAQRLLQDTTIFSEVRQSLVPKGGFRDEVRQLQDKDTSGVVAEARKRLGGPACVASTGGP